jgi:hypothetical protein
MHLNDYMRCDAMRCKIIILHYVSELIFNINMTYAVIWFDEFM